MFKLEQDKGCYRVRFKSGDSLKTIYLGTREQALAEYVFQWMQQDLDRGCFDQTGEKYRKAQLPPSPKPTNKTLTLDQLFLSYLEQEREGVTNVHLHYAYRCIVSYGNRPRWDEVEWFLALRQKLSAETWNRRKFLYTACTNWALVQGLIEAPKNPWCRIKPKREPRSSKADPFTPDEVKRIIEAFASNRFMNPNSHYPMSHYVPFITFLLTYGVRLGEAIALRWSRVDFQHKLIVIDSALGRDIERSINATAKVIKTTKTSDVRYLPMTDDIATMLRRLKQTNRRVTPESFVFEGHIGRYIDTRNFRLVWKAVLKGLNITYRYPYQCRHTVLSHVASEHGLAAAASLAGHKSLDMASRHYVKFTGSIASIIPQWNI